VKVEIERWLDAALTAIEESVVTLGFDPPRRGARERSASPELFGALVSVASDRTSIQVGILSTRGGHAAVARTMLAIEPSEEVAEDDIADAIRELTNLVAGGLKRAMIDRDSGLRIGLPVFIHGAVEKTASLELAVQYLNLSGESVAIVVLQAASARAA
jgi:hypothetical protein